MKTFKTNEKDKYNGKVLNIEKWIAVLKNLKTWLAKRRYVDILLKNCESSEINQNMIPLIDVNLAINCLYEDINTIEVSP